MKPTIAGIALVLSVAGCGGGSGGGGMATVADDAASTPYSLSAAVSAFLQVPHDYRLSASTGSNSYTLTWHSEPGSPALFEDHLSSTMNYSNLIEMNGTAIAGSSLTDYFDLVPFRPIGGVNHTLGNYDVASEQLVLPTTAVIGQAGAAGNGTRYADASKSKIIATTTTSWSLETAGTALAWACMNVTISYESPGASPGAESICYKIDTSGNVTGVKMSLVLNGQLVSFY